MQTEDFSPKDSLQLIKDMIAKARHDMSDNSIYFLLWGWTIFAACVAQFVLKNVLDYAQYYLVWWIMVPTVFISAYIGMKDKRKQKTHTYIGDSMKYLWMGMGISFFVLSMIFSRYGWNITTFPVFIMLYGLGTFISGKILQFKPLVFGGIAAWVLAVITVYVDPEYQMLFGAASILVSYIIPAYLLRKKEHSINN